MAVIAVSRVSRNVLNVWLQMSATGLTALSLVQARPLQQKTSVNPEVFYPAAILDGADAIFHSADFPVPAVFAHGAAFFGSGTPETRVKPNLRSQPK